MDNKETNVISNERLLILLENALMVIGDKVLNLNEDEDDMLFEIMNEEIGLTEEEWEEIWVNN